MESNSGPIRRNGASTSTPQPPSPASSNSITAVKSPFLPTSLEAILLAIYPSTLLLGSLFSLLEPNARAAPYSAISQSHPSELAPSYFAQKKNLFNVFFVKIGWFWTTLAFCVFIFMHPSTGPSRSLVLTPKRAQGFLRYGIVTLWWAIVTQWFFGPALIDRGFRLTGGQCELLQTEEGRGGMGETRVYFTAAACKLGGGKWTGGYDISGHVFLLVLGSAFLWLEILPVVLRHAGLREERLIRHADGSVKNAASEAHLGSSDKDDPSAATGGVSAPVAVAGLSWWMLLMTAAYFHTWFEKVCNHTPLLRTHS